MVVNKHYVSLVVICLWTPVVNQGFNIGYHGTDAHESYETSWGKERFVKEDYLNYFKYYKKYEESIPVLDDSKAIVLQAPYDQLTEVWSYYDFGMYFNSEYIAKLFEHNHIANVIEIGSFYGLSTRHIARLLPEHGRVYAIDTWAYFDGMYTQFLSNIIRAGLTHKIVPIRQRSEFAVPYVTKYASSFDLVYVDGDHEKEGVLKDLRTYYPLLSEHGVICGDDWLLYTIRSAVVQFAQEHNLTIYAACNFWFLKDEGAFAQRCFLDMPDEVWKF